MYTKHVAIEIVVLSVYKYITLRLHTSYTWVIS